MPTDSKPNRAVRQLYSTVELTQLNCPFLSVAARSVHSSSYPPTKISRCMKSNSFCARTFRSKPLFHRIGSILDETIETAERLLELLPVAYSASDQRRLQKGVAAPHRVDCIIEQPYLEIAKRPPHNADRNVRPESASVWE